MVFRAGKDSRPGTYKTDIECLLVCASLLVKKGGARLANSMRTMAFQAPEMPMKLTDLTAADYNFELEKYKEGLRRATQYHFGDQDNNLKAYKIVYSHCAPRMISKIKTIARWINVQEDQDGMGLIKIVHGAIFAHD